MAFTFGAAQPAANTAAPLFGSAAPAATTTSLFGAAPAKTAAPLFGATTSAATTAPLFGASATTAPSQPLFGSPAPVPATGGGLFGTNVTTTSAAAAPLFGAPAASTASTGLFGTAPSTSAAPSLFGASSTLGGAPKPLFGTAPASTASTGGLFGSPATSAAGTTSLFGTPSTAAPASIGLGGAATTATTIGGLSGMGGGLGAGGSDVKQEAQVENPKEGKVEQPQLDLLAAIRTELAENKKYADEFACKSSDECLKIEDRVRQLERRISGISVNSASLSANEEKLRSRTARDLRLAQVATMIQDNAAKNIYTNSNQGRLYMIQLIREYNDQLEQYYQTIEELQQKVLQMQNGTSAISEKDISDHLGRFDQIFSAVAVQIVQTTDKISDLKEIFNEEHPGVLAREASYSSFHPSSSSGPAYSAAASAAANARRLAGEPALPSQATALQIGQYFRQAAPQPAATGGLFGSTGATGGGLFGASTAAKPFSFATPAAAPTGTTGSLFGAAPSTAPTSTSLFGSTATPAASSSLTFGKPSTGTGNASSAGLLFSSTSTPTKSLSLFGK